LGYDVLVYELRKFNGLRIMKFSHT